MINKDPYLNSTGRTNMGDADSLQSNHPQIFDPSGNVAQSEQQLSELAAEIAAQPLSWHLDEEATEEEGKDMWFPRLFIPGIAEKFGQSRPFKQFYPQERNMFLTLFLNDNALYLFGHEAFDVALAEGGVEFVPNPDFAVLAVRTDGGDKPDPK